jgi:hypothetical protein
MHVVVFVVGLALQQHELYKLTLILSDLIIMGAFGNSMSFKLKFNYLHFIYIMFYM